MKQVAAVRHRRIELRAFRRKVMADNNWSLRDLYRTLDVPGLNPLRDVLAGDLGRMFKDLIEMETARRLAEL